MYNGARMGRLHTLERWLVLAAAALITFVVVCPLTPTPIAVVTSVGKAPAPALVGMLLAIALLLPLLPVLTRVLYVATGEHGVPLMPAAVRELTCVRLC